MKNDFLKQEVKIQTDSITINGSLAVPKNAKSIVLFAHGSGSSRFSPRNQYVAKVLQNKGIATLLIDLLTEDEDLIYENRFNIDLLTQRLIDVFNWLKENPKTKSLVIGIFGASTGAASALKVAASLGKEIGAVVSRGGRPDLAMNVLEKIVSPTLLIVGGNDFGVIELNQKALENLKSIKKLEIVPDATHLFEEPGALEKVSELAKKWFNKYLIKN